MNNIPKWASNPDSELMVLDNETIETGFKHDQLISAGYVNAALHAIVTYSENYATQLITNSNITNNEEIQNAIKQAIEKNITDGINKNGSSITADQVQTIVNNSIKEALINYNNKAEVNNEIQVSIQNALKQLSIPTTESISQEVNNEISKSNLVTQSDLKTSETNTITKANSAFMESLKPLINDLQGQINAVYDNCPSNSDLGKYVLKFDLTTELSNENKTITEAYTSLINSSIEKLKTELPNESSDITNLTKEVNTNTQSIDSLNKKIMPLLQLPNDAVLKSNLENDLNGYVKKTTLTNYITQSEYEKLSQQNDENQKQNIQNQINNAINNLSGQYVTQEELSETTSDYLSTQNIVQYLTGQPTMNLNASSISPTFVTSNQITDFITNATLNKTLSNYATLTDIENIKSGNKISDSNFVLNTTYTDFVNKTNSELTTIEDKLKTYLTENNLTTTLSSYALKSTLEQLTNEVVMKSDLPTEVHKLTGDYVTTPTYNSEIQNINSQLSALSDMTGYMVSYKSLASYLTGQSIPGLLVQPLTDPFIQKSNLTSTLSDYALKSELPSLTGYVNTETMNTNIQDAVSKINKSLENYSTTSYLNTELEKYALSSSLSNYITTNNLQTELSNYTQNSQLTKTLENYILKTQIPDISSLVSTAILSNTLNGYVTNQSFHTILTSEYISKQELENTLGTYITKTILSTSLEPYALKTEIPNVSDLVTTSNLTTELSKYALITSLPNMSNYITTTELDTKGYITNSSLNTTLENYETKSSLTTTLEGYAKTSDIPNISNLVSNTSLTSTLENYALKTDLINTLNNYILKTELPNISNLVTNEVLTKDLSSYVTNSNLNTELENYALKSELTQYSTTITMLHNKITELQNQYLAQSSLFINLNNLDKPVLTPEFTAPRASYTLEPGVYSSPGSVAVYEQGPATVNVQGNNNLVNFNKATVCVTGWTCYGGIGYDQCFNSGTPVITNINLPSLGGVLFSYLNYFKVNTKIKLPPINQSNVLFNINSKISLQNGNYIGWLVYKYGSKTLFIASSPIMNNVTRQMLIEGNVYCGNSILKVTRNGITSYFKLRILNTIEFMDIFFWNNIINCKSLSINTLGASYNWHALTNYTQNMSKQVVPANFPKVNNNFNVWYGENELLLHAQPTMNTIQMHWTNSNSVFSNPPQQVQYPITDVVFGAPNMVQNGTENGTYFWRPILELINEDQILPFMPIIEFTEGSLPGYLEEHIQQPTETDHSLWHQLKDYL